MESFAITFGISKINDKLLTLNSLVLYENNTIRPFTMEFETEMLDYIKRFVEPEMFVVYDNEVSIVANKNAINNLLKNIKIPTMLEDRLLYRTYKIENIVFHTFEILNNQRVKRR